MQEVASKISLIASQARLWVETNFSGIFAENLCGACAIASTYILKRLQDENIAAKVVISRTNADKSEHAYVLAGDTVIDVTATQFQDYTSKFIPPIIIVDRERAKEFYWRDVFKTFDTPEEVVKHTKDPAWPKYQIPDLNMIEELYENF